MPNIVYVLTNPAMPGIVKIGMTDRAEVRRRMDDLYTTGVPLPFDCIIAWEIEDRYAVEIERALHAAFGPNRINPAREFFQVEPEQVEVLLRVMAGRDVTPSEIGRPSELDSDDREASEKYKRRQSRTNEVEFLDLVNENGRTVYQRVLSLGLRDSLRVNWGSKGFTLNAVLNGTTVVICYGYPMASVYRQKLYTDFDVALRKTNLKQEDVAQLRTDGLNTGLFAPVGKGDNLVCETDRSWDENELVVLTGWLTTFAESIRECDSEG